MRPAVQQILDAMTGAAAFVRNDRLDILGGNELGHALYSEMFIRPVRPVNTARFVFLDRRARDFYVDWERAATDVVAVLRSAAGRDPTTVASQTSSGAARIEAGAGVAVAAG